MDYKTMTVEAIEARKAAISVEVDTEGADLDALQAEARAINEELEARKAEASKRAEIRKAVANSAISGVKPVQEPAAPTLEEVRKSDRYVEAYANYIRTGRADECRAILTETNPSSVSGSGPVPVPVLVDQIVRTAWESDEILSRVRKTNFKGNLKVAFERSADAAVVHTEGTSAPSEESLTLGIVTMIPANIKKWIRITDEAMTMGGAAFLDYVYRELTYQIIRKLSALVIGDISGASTSHSSSAIGIPKVKVAPSTTTVATAMGNLSDEARDTVIIMNRLTHAAFYEAFAAGNFAVDPFMGMKVLFTSALPAYSTASENDVYAIIGDLSGAQVNYPEGEGVVIKLDDLSEAESDLVKVVGRQYAAHAVTGPGRFVNVTKPAAAST